MNNLKLGFLGTLSWLATISGIVLLKDILQILAFASSIVVSVFGCWWIYRQDKALQARLEREKSGRLE